MDLMKCNNLYSVNKLWVYKLVFISAILKLIIIYIIIITIKWSIFYLYVILYRWSPVPLSVFQLFIFSSFYHLVLSRQSVIKKGGFF